MKSGSAVIVKRASHHLEVKQVVNVHDVIDEHYVRVVIHKEPFDIIKKVCTADLREVKF